MIDKKLAMANLESVLNDPLNNEDSPKAELLAKRLSMSKFDPKSDEHARYAEQQLNEVAHHIYFLHKDIIDSETGSKRIINRGTSQIVIDIGDGLVAKMRYFQSDNHPNNSVTPNHLMVRTNFISYGPSLVETYETLREMGLPVLEHICLGGNMHLSSGKSFEVDDNGYYFCVSKDISERGKYEVKEIDDMDFERLVNGEKLEAQYEEMFKRLCTICDGNDEVYEARLQGHEHKDCSLAISHMFMVQVDPDTNKGKLYIADIDHITFKKKYLIDHKK